ncbi:hypothetical protein BKA69DRAFT_1143488, partial [Paraphysoderma sedebokerense]
ANLGHNFRANLGHNFRANLGHNFRANLGHNFRANLGHNFRANLGHNFRADEKPASPTLNSRPYINQISSFICRPTYGPIYPRIGADSSYINPSKELPKIQLRAQQVSGLYSQEHSFAIWPSNPSLKIKQYYHNTLTGLAALKATTMILAFDLFRMTSANFVLGGGEEYLNLEMRSDAVVSQPMNRTGSRGVAW